MPPWQGRKSGPQLIGFAIGGLLRAYRGFGWGGLGGDGLIAENRICYQPKIGGSRCDLAMWAWGGSGEGRPILPLLLVRPVGDGGRQVVGGVLGWWGSRSESENPGNGGDEVCSYFGWGEAENVVAMAGNVDVTMDLVLENIESVLGSANVFAVAVDFDNQPIVEEEIHTLQRPPTNDGAVGDRDDGLWGN